MNTWSKEEIIALKKRVYGNITDDEILEKLRLLEAHLQKYHHSILPRKRRDEWSSVEQIAGAIARLIRQRYSISLVP